MRIAQVAPLYVNTPPGAYGGTERIISILTETLVQMGHDVTLFATGESRTRARLVAGAPSAQGFSHPFESDAAHIAMLASVYRRAGEFDIIHSHIDSLALPFAAAASVPTVFTLHMSLEIPSYQAVLSAFPTQRYVSISDSQRAPAPDLNWVATVYHGIDTHLYPMGDKPGSYLLFVGRISPEKGPDRAIAIARRCGIPLKIAAKVDPKDRAFFERQVKPLLDDPLIEYIGPADERKKRDLMKNALALLLPIRWNEPFGLVFIEALACGLPVLTCPCGSAPELLRDGVTGFMRDTDDELVEAVLRAHEVPRAGCRAWVEQRFDAAIMTQRYVEVYQAALEERQHPMEFPAGQHVEDPLMIDTAYPPEQVSGS